MHFSSFCRLHTKFVHFYSVLCTFSFMLFFLEPLPVIPLAGSVVLNLSMIDPAYDQAFLLAFPHQTLENPWHIDSSLEGKFTSHFCMIPLVLLAPPLTLLFFSAIAFLSPSYFSFVLLCFPLTFYFLILSALFLNHKSVCPLWLCLASSLCLIFLSFKCNSSWQALNSLSLPSLILIMHSRLSFKREFSRVNWAILLIGYSAASVMLFQWRSLEKVF